VDWSVFDDDVFAGGDDWIMKCPTCGENTPNAWQHLWVAEGDEQSGVRVIDKEIKDDRRGASELLATAVLWMRCANEECREVVIRIRDRSLMALPPHHRSEEWIARPQLGAASRPLPKEVNEPYRSDYLQAAAILGISPRASAVLSRRILADLLEEYAQLSQFRLVERIAGFIADTQHPSGLRENLEYLAEIGNFGAHTQKNDQAEIIDVGAEEAEWTLDIVERLFDYFIVTPERDRAMRKAFNKKLEDAGRREIKAPPDSEG
jgi:hypothetical protein